MLTASAVYLLTLFFYLHIFSYFENNEKIVNKKTKIITKILYLAISM
ncbi:hypothetical protein VRK_24610 [Vibrio sp. MEBiC08052]|nr:hypothetical protein VRK_24610 [Vibrio sp. MEBiC08052]